MAGEKKEGGHGRGRGRPPKNKKQAEEVPVNNAETEVNTEEENEEEEIRLEPVVVKAISNEVRKILKDLLPSDRTKAEKEITKEGATEEGEKANSSNIEHDEDEVLIINNKGSGSSTKGPKGSHYMQMIVFANVIDPSEVNILGVFGLLIRTVVCMLMALCCNNELF
ncbi:hypothetical protein E3N88_14204 [Mikania micrantha]|uniref:Uncharacterized protein n=1 Tax=Mikania micrantha TaxID=192012 RepID=A0A5N6P0S6_9ASTR|nr:hypothetical protein E3N88_14204 [Mikania micrantha]